MSDGKTPEQRKERCKTCRWWVESRLKERGECHFSAPIAIPDRETYSFTFPFPRTYPESFCGQWTPIEDDQVRTLKDGEIAVRLDVLNAFRISPVDIREVSGTMQMEEIKTVGERIKTMGEWALKEAEAKFGNSGEDPRTPWTPIESAEKNDCEPVLLLIDGPDDLAPIVGYWAHHEWVSLESDATIFPRYCAPIPKPPGYSSWQP